MFDPAVRYAVKEGPDQYELFDDNHISLGFNSEQYISTYKIPLYSKEYQRLWFNEYIKNTMEGK